MSRDAKKILLEIKAQRNKARDLAEHARRCLIKYTDGLGTTGIERAAEEVLATDSLLTIWEELHDSLHREEVEFEDIPEAAVKAANSLRAIANRSFIGATQSSLRPSDFYLMQARITVAIKVFEIREGVIRLAA